MRPIFREVVTKRAPGASAVRYCFLFNPLRKTGRLLPYLCPLRTIARNSEEFSNILQPCTLVWSNVCIYLYLIYINECPSVYVFIFRIDPYRSMDPVIWDLNFFEYFDSRNQSDGSSFELL